MGVIIASLANLVRLEVLPMQPAPFGLRVRSRGVLPSLARPARKLVLRASGLYKLVVKSISLIGLVIAVPSAAWADPWCAEWKTQQMCASPEDFRIFANRVCLQAQARENPTVEESMTLHTDCQAAKILAHKAELAKTRRDQATAAQKELDAMRR